MRQEAAAWEAGHEAALVQIRVLEQRANEIFATKAGGSGVAPADPPPVQVCLSEDCQLPAAVDPISGQTYDFCLYSHAVGHKALMALRELQQQRMQAPL